MKKILLFIALPLLVSSCLKDGELNFTERKVVGEWFYTDATYRENLRLFQKDDLFETYDGAYFNFNADKSVTYTQPSSGDSFSGEWDLVNTYNGDYSGNTLVISMVNNSTNAVEQVIFENFAVSNRKMRGQYSTNEGTYHYCLEK